MNSRRENQLKKIYPVCFSILGTKSWNRIVGLLDKPFKPATLANRLASGVEDITLPEFLPELAKLEWVYYSISMSRAVIPKEVETFKLNPTLEMLRLSWQLVNSLTREENIHYTKPAPGEQWALVWRDVTSGQARVQAASSAELLAIKIIADGLSIEKAASRGKVPAGTIYNILYASAKRGLILMPRSSIVRNVTCLPQGLNIPGQFIFADKFSLQWHITNACDLHCKHCYDRSKRRPLSLKQGLKILNDLYVFCRKHNVAGHVCFSGGNPFLSPRFIEFYRNAAENGFSISILANPVSERQLEEVIKIQRPDYFQVSLEGLREHNDIIRGKGNFDRVMKFLSTLGDFGVSSAVMLTLTKDNIKQVIPLAEILRDKTDHFTFNRLSPIGEGSELKLPSRDQYAAFLADYLDAAKNNPMMGLKDNLINIELHKRGNEPFDGCSGFGCGAAFNFVAVLADGEVHACRKFPSLIGDITTQSLGDIYDSALAARYRKRSSACRLCKLKHACGGCLAVIRGYGLSIFEDRDPHCFFAEIPATEDVTKLLKK